MFQRFLPWFSLFFAKVFPSVFPMIPLFFPRFSYIFSHGSQERALPGPFPQPAERRRGRRFDGPAAGEAGDSAGQAPRRRGALGVCHVQGAQEKVRDLWEWSSWDRVKMNGRWLDGEGDSGIWWNMNIYIYINHINEWDLTWHPICHVQYRTTSSYINGLLNMCWDNWIWTWFTYDLTFTVLDLLMMFWFMFHPGKSTAIGE